MVSRGVMWTTGAGLRWFVRAAALLVGLASLVGVILWFVGGLYVLAGDGASLGEAFPSVLVTVIASLATSEIVLRVFELPGRSFWHRYWIVVRSVALTGAPLAVLYAIDGTMGADPTRSVYAILYADPLSLLGAVPVGLVGAVFGLVLGLVEGLGFGVPLAKLLGALSDEG